MGAAGTLSAATAAATAANRLTGMVLSQASCNGPASRTPLPHYKPSRRFARQCLDSAGNFHLTYTDGFGGTSVAAGDGTTASVRV